MCITCDSVSSTGVMMCVSHVTVSAVVNMKSWIHIISDITPVQYRCYDVDPGFHVSF